MRWARLAALLACLTATGAQGELGDRQWCVESTPWFDYLSDERADTARRTVLELARFRETYLDLWPDARGEGVPVKMVMFSRSREFYDAVGSRDFGGYTIPSLFEYRLLMTEGPPSATNRRVPFHEYAHYLLRNQTDRSYPLWYEEGLATYLSAVEFDRNTSVLGALPTSYLRRTTRTVAEPSLAEVIGATSVRQWEPRQMTVFYDKSWVLVHFLRLGHLVDFDDHRASLNDYLADPTRAFTDVFATTPDALGKELTRYLRRGRFGRETVARATDTEVTPTRRCLTDRERDYELALTLTAHNPTLARELLIRHELQSSPDHLVALSRTLPATDTARSRALIRQALTLDPDHPGALIALANHLVARCTFINSQECFDRWYEAARSYRHALRVDPSRFDAAFGLGIAYTHLGRAGDAMNYLKVAYDKAPWAPALNFYLGEGYRIIGDDRAVIYLANARNWSTEDVWRRRAELALERIATDP